MVVYHCTNQKNILKQIRGHLGFFFPKLLDEKTSQPFTSFALFFCPYTGSDSFNYHKKHVPRNNCHQRQGVQLFGGDQSCTPKDMQSTGFRSHRNHHLHCSLGCPRQMEYPTFWGFASHSALSTLVIRKPLSRQCVRKKLVKILLCNCWVDFIFAMSAPFQVSSSIRRWAR